MKKLLTIILISVLCALTFCACAKAPIELLGKLEGVITENDAPISGVKVTSGKVVTYTDANGYYSLDVYTDGLRVTFEKEGCLSLAKTFTVNSFYRETIEYNAVMFYKTMVYGKVLNGDQPVSGADVTLGARTVKTNEKGEYSFENVLCTDMIVIVEYDGKGAQKHVYYAELKDGEEKVDFDLEGV